MARHALLATPRPYAVERAVAHYPDRSPEEIAETLWWSTFVNRDRRYLYYETPKACSTTIKTVIQQIEGLALRSPLAGAFRESRREMFIHDRAHFAMPSILDFDDNTQREILSDEDFLRFTVVRNPYDRLESAWKDKIRGCEPGYGDFYLAHRGALPNAAVPASIIGFAEFVDIIAGQDLSSCDPHWRLQAHCLLHPAFDFNHIGRAEDLAATINLFRRHWARMGPPMRRPSHSAAPPRANLSDRSSHYDPQLRRRVGELYATDFAVFGYPRNGETSIEPIETQGSGRGGTIGVDQHVGEILERNILIDALYDKIQRLEAGLASAAQTSAPGSLWSAAQDGGNGIAFRKSPDTEI